MALLQIQMLFDKEWPCVDRLRWAQPVARSCSWSFHKLPTCKTSSTITTTRFSIIIIIIISTNRPHNAQYRNRMESTNLSILFSFPNSNSQLYAFETAP